MLLASLALSDGPQLHFAGASDAGVLLHLSTLSVCLIKRTDVFGVLEGVESDDLVCLDLVIC